MAQTLATNNVPRKQYLIWSELFDCPYTNNNLSYETNPDDIDQILKYHCRGEKETGASIRLATSATKGPFISLSAFALIQAGSLMNVAQAISR